jgi:hypothetical protein
VTTIAYKNGVLAADSLINYGSFSNGEVNKIHVISVPEDDGRRVRRAMLAVSGIVWVSNLSSNGSRAVPVRTTSRTAFSLPPSSSPAS